MSLGTRGPASSPLNSGLLRGSQGRLREAPLRLRAALAGTLPEPRPGFSLLARRDTWSCFHHQLCNEAGVLWKSEQLQIYSELTLSLCCSCEAVLLAVDRSQRFFHNGD